MATRPVFISNIKNKEYITIKNIEFNWYPGFSQAQKQKSIKALHNNFIAQNPNKKILEISSKSTEKLGIMLSAFNLNYKSKYYNKDISVECAFQGSKVFENAGPFEDLYFKSSIEAKRDPRTKNSGALKNFQFENIKWELEPKTLFYDWLYLKALSQNKELLEKLLDYDAFTDIEFNPERSYNCQARTAALCVSLNKLGLLDDALNSIDDYRCIINDRENKCDQLSFLNC